MFCYVFVIKNKKNWKSITLFSLTHKYWIVEKYRSLRILLFYGIREVENIQCAFQMNDLAMEVFPANNILLRTNTDQLDGTPRIGRLIKKSSSNDVSKRSFSNDCLKISDATEIFRWAQFYSVCLTDRCQFQWLSNMPSSCSKHNSIIKYWFCLLLI